MWNDKIYKLCQEDFELWTKCRRMLQDKICHTNFWTECFMSWPNTRKVNVTCDPAKAWRLNWVGGNSTWGSIVTFDCKWLWFTSSSSSSTNNRNACHLRWCCFNHFWPQLKQRPFLWRFANSDFDRWHNLCFDGGVGNYIRFERISVGFNGG